MNRYPIGLLFLALFFCAGGQCEPEKEYPGGIKCSDVPVLASYESIKAELRKMQDKKRLEKGYFRAARTLPRNAKNIAEEKNMQKDALKLSADIQVRTGWLRYCKLK
jgi:hypothetical protein